MHFRICYTMNAEDIFRSSIGCEIMLMIKARIRLIFSRYTYLLNNNVTKFFLRYVKGDSNPNDKYVLSERALCTMNFDTSIIKIG